jgi:hypothetical protein
VNELEEGGEYMGVKRDWRWEKRIEAGGLM